jgi:hypothetical protein
MFCKSGHWSVDTDFQADADGRGDVPLVELRWRCGRCGSRLTDAGWLEVQAAEFRRAVRMG